MRRWPLCITECGGIRVLSCLPVKSARERHYCSGVCFSYSSRAKMLPMPMCSTACSRRPSFCSIFSATSGFRLAGKNKSELLLELGQFLISRSSKKQTTVLIVDEAHHLSADILEEVRLLTNLETTDDKLLQILLVGQPELDREAGFGWAATAQAENRLACASRPAGCGGDAGLY